MLSQEEEKAIMRQIGGVYSALSPETLTCDGELPREEVAKREASLRAELRTLEAKLGREVSEEEGIKAMLAAWER